MNADTVDEDESEVVSMHSGKNKSVRFYILQRQT